MHKRKRITDIKNIGFVSKRIAGTDGVTLEIKKWAEVLEGMHYACFYFAGELDTPQESSMLSPKAHFSHPQIASINEFVFKNAIRSEDINDEFFRKYDPISWNLFSLHQLCYIFTNNVKEVITSYK